MSSSNSILIAKFSQRKFASCSLAETLEGVWGLFCEDRFGKAEG